MATSTGWRINAISRAASSNPGHDEQGRAYKETKQNRGPCYTTVRRER
jgi:hypothetical protein